MLLCGILLVGIVLLFSFIFQYHKCNYNAESEKLGYAICMKENTYENTEWKQVAEVLEKKYQELYDVKIFLYKDFVSELKEKLSQFMPRYVCFVMSPEDIASYRGFVSVVHEMLRELDNDPYGDAIWGIITGYDVEDAIKMAKYDKPLILEKVLSGCGAAFFQYFCEGKGFDETRQGIGYIKTKDGGIEECKVSPDATEEIVKEINSNQYDFIVTSGHATQHDWQIGYTFKSGQFRHREGQLFGWDTNGNKYNINSTNPKVYFGVGNCLIAQVDDKDCMVTSWIHSGGVYQFYGYTVPTWYGFSGWKVPWFFMDHGNYLTFSESVFLTNQILIAHLVQKTPEVINNSQHLKGHLYDRDACVLYGDPALEVRMSEECKKAALFEPFLEITPVEWKKKEYRITFKVTVKRDFEVDPTGADAVATLFPFKVKQVKEVKTSENVVPIITDDFVLLQLKGKVKKGEIKEISFIASKR